MTYFQLHIQPIDVGSSDAVVLDKFHPRWKEATERLMSRTQIKEIMNQYARGIGKWTKLEIELVFDDKRGLTHVNFPFRTGLDLCEGMGGEPRYRSHNVHGIDVALAVSAVITHYINWMNFVIGELEEGG